MNRPFSGLIRAVLLLAGFAPLCHAKLYPVEGTSHVVDIRNISNNPARPDAWDLTPQEIQELLTAMSRFPPEHLRTVQFIATKRADLNATTEYIPGGMLIGLRSPQVRAVYPVDFMGDFGFMLPQHIYYEQMTDSERLQYGQATSGMGVVEFTIDYYYWSSNTNSNIYQRGFLQSHAALASYLYVSQFFADPATGKVRIYTTSRDKKTTTLNFESYEWTKDNLSFGEFRFSLRGEAVIGVDHFGEGRNLNPPLALAPMMVRKFTPTDLVQNDLALQAVELRDAIDRDYRLTGAEKSAVREMLRKVLPSHLSGLKAVQVKPIEVRPPDLVGQAALSADGTTLTLYLPETARRPSDSRVVAQVLAQALGDRYYERLLGPSERDEWSRLYDHQGRHRLDFAETYRSWLEDSKALLRRALAAFLDGNVVPMQGALFAVSQFMETGFGGNLAFDFNYARTGLLTFAWDTMSWINGAIRFAEFSLMTEGDLVTGVRTASGSVVRAPKPFTVPEAFKARVSQTRVSFEGLGDEPAEPAILSAPSIVPSAKRGRVRAVTGTAAPNVYMPLHTPAAESPHPVSPIYTP